LAAWSIFKKVKPRLINSQTGHKSGGGLVCTQAGIHWTIPLYAGRHFLDDPSGGYFPFWEGNSGVYSLVFPSECTNGFFLRPSIRSWDKNPLLWI